MAVNPETHLPRYVLDIDEEGFPQFDGLRVQDEELLLALMSALHRIDPGVPTSTLTTDCEGEEVFVNAFDAPLVAQSIDTITDQDSVWVFPGGWSQRIPHSALSVDPWNRIHASIGPDDLPAVLSRKAQAHLLNRIPTGSFHLPVFRAPQTDVREPAFWSRAYSDEQDGWELNKPTPCLPENWASVEAALPSGASILVPGAGRGHDAFYLEQMGYKVTALDFVPEAREDFKAIYPKAKLTYEVGDVFRYLTNHAQQFDAVFEHTLFCAIDPSRRQEYVRDVHQALKPSGHWFGVFFLLTWRGGPPFGLTQWELRELTREFFQASAWKAPCKNSVPTRYGQELWAVLKKT